MAGDAGLGPDALVANPEARAALPLVRLVAVATGGGATVRRLPMLQELQTGLDGRAVGLSVRGVGASDLTILVEVVDVGRGYVGFEGRTVGLGSGVSDDVTVAVLAVLLDPVSPISLPKKNTSLAGRPVSAVALTITSSHFCVMAPLAHIISTRSVPLVVPAPLAAGPVMPVRTDDGVGQDGVGGPTARRVVVAHAEREIIGDARGHWR